MLALKFDILTLILDMVLMHDIFVIYPFQKCMYNEFIVIMLKKHFTRFRHSRRPLQCVLRKFKVNFALRLDGTISRGAKPRGEVAKPKTELAHRDRFIKVAQL